MRTTLQLRNDALAIWQAGVDAVRSDRLVRDHVQVDGDTLIIGDEELNLHEVDRILVVGAGKAGAGMAAGLEQALGAELMQEKRLTGWVNVPADCVRQLNRIHLHAARPAGVNEPTEAGVLGGAEILRLVASAGPRDVCICLISGGGSALLPAPVDGVSLADKQRVTQILSGTGANIEELNTVRKHLSRIKGGGLARACRAGRLFTLIISDVLGDPLDVIASGPTVADSSTAANALAVLERFGGREAGVPESIFTALGHWEGEAPAEPNVLGGAKLPLSRFGSAGASPSQAGALPSQAGTSPSHARNLVIGNNALAVDAAGIEAERRGYSHAMHAATKLEGPAEEVGRHLAGMARRMREQPGPDCLITGGEPVVQLVDESVRGKGGRNQQLVLAAMLELLENQSAESTNPCAGICLLSGGTDGEDGPTDAAGAFFNADVTEAMREQGLNPADFLRRNDAYNFFAPLGALIKTGPTDTNVCDVRVMLVERR